MISLTDAIKLRNVRAFLWAIRYGEGTQGDDGFQTLFGGKLFTGKDRKLHTFDDFADHPRLKVTVRLKKGGTLTSTAAGAGQFLERTWDGLVKQYGFSDFSPPNQELGMVALIAGRGALTDVIVGNWRDAVMKCSKEWASLPGSPYGQPVVTMDDFKREYHEAGGLDFPEDQLAIAQQQTGQALPTLPEPKLPPGPAHPVVEVGQPQPSNLPTASKLAASPIKEAFMAVAPALATAALGPVSPFAAALLPALLNLVPQLTKIFGSGSEVAQRNAAAVDAVVNVAKGAIGAKNEQEVLEVISSDPEQAQKVKDAIEHNFLQIVEAGGGGIQGARDYSVQLATLRDADGHAIPLSKQPAFVISTVLLVMVFLTMFLVLMPWELWTDGNVQLYSDEVRLIVVTAMITGTLSAIVAFWLGSSFQSRQKDNTNSALASALGTRVTDR